MQTIQESPIASVRIPVPLLDALMNLAGELVLGRNQLLQAIGCDDKRLLDTTSQRIDMVTSEIQEQIMRTRMQPMGTLFDTLPRLVRDLGQKSGQAVSLSISGKTVEIDKTIMDALARPLTRLIEQAVQHGIESLRRPAEQLTDTVNIDLVLSTSQARVGRMKVSPENIRMGYPRVLFLPIEPLRQGLAHGMITR